MTIKLRGDFNGLVGDVLCLSHSETATDGTGAAVVLCEGMEVVAFEPDCDDDGTPAFLVAHGRVIRSPEALQNHGSRWSLRIDENGVRLVATLDDA